MALEPLFHLNILKSFLVRHNLSDETSDGIHDNDMGQSVTSLIVSIQEYKDQGVWF